MTKSLHELHFSLSTLKALVFIGFVLFAFKIRAQEDPISGIYEQTPLDSVLLDLEVHSGYNFFFIEDWLKDKRISARFSEANLEQVLDEILKESELNYYIDPKLKRVYLLQNTLVYDQLPAGFFGPERDTTAASEVRTTPLPPPVFMGEDIRTTGRQYAIARIGKAGEGAVKERYVLSGRALMSGTGRPVADLAIRIRGTGLGTVTDEAGNYRFELPPGYYTLTATAMGVARMERELVLYSDGNLDLLMEEGIELLEEVVVEADAARNVEEVTTGTERIESEESKDIPLVLGERDVLQVAKTLPGISSAGEGASGINVRGGKTDQNLFLLDDAVLYNPTHFFGIFQALNPFTTESVEIYKGAPPAEYGGRISSVFDIRSKNGNTSEVAAEGSIGPVTANLALEVPLKEDTSSLLLGGRGAYADWILRSLDDEDLSNSSASFFDAIARFRTKLGETGALSATAYGSRDSFTITSDSLYRYTNALASVRWDHSYSEKTRAALVAAHSDYRFGIDFDGESNTDFALDYGISQTQLRYALSSKLGTMHDLDYGVSANYYSVNPGSRTPEGPDSALETIEIPREQAFEGAIFVGDQLKLSDRLLLDLGLRYNFFAALGSGTQRTYLPGQPRNEGSVVDTLSYGSGEAIETYGGPEVRISGRYFLQPDFSVKASLHNSYQFLHTLSNNTTISPIDTWKLSDLNIRPQKGYQATLGFYKNFNDNMYEVSVEGYYKLMEDVLDFKTGSQLFLNRHVETEVLQGDGKAYGVEFLLKKSRGKLNGWLGYTYSRSLYRFDSPFEEERINNGGFFPSNFDKPHDLSLIANYRLTRRYSFSMNFVYQTGRPVTYPVGTFRFNDADFVFYSDRNAFRVPDYYRLDLGINIEGNHKKDKLAHSFWTISVYNVLGRNNPYSVFFVTDGGEVKALQSSIFAIPVPAITYNFKF